MDFPLYLLFSWLDIENGRLIFFFPRLFDIFCVFEIDSVCRVVGANVSFGWPPVLVFIEVPLVIE